jgi:Protein of unknown function (DUF3017)
MDGVHQGQSRRPPVTTEGILPPEGSKRTAGGSAPAPVRQWPILLVIGGVALGLLITVGASFRAGAMVVGTFLVLAAVLRIAVPDVGLLAVRSRFTDVITLGVMGVGIILFGLMVMPGPWLQLPWLTDVVRFAVR